ncbi:MAG TPA: hypothetical protein HPP87_10025 [Planctomycetes bacterium]|nr:hypothetical protein [Planctomycetota bacterium]
MSKKQVKYLLWATCIKHDDKIFVVGIDAEDRLEAHTRIQEFLGGSGLDPDVYQQTLLIQPPGPPSVEQMPMKKLTPATFDEVQEKHNEATNFHSSKDS